MGKAAWKSICSLGIHTILGVALGLILPAQAYSTPASPLLHNSDQFACSLSLYVTEADCTDNDGTWAPSRKWTGGWGSAGLQYGTINCSTCHVRTPGNGNIKRLRPSINAAEGIFPGGAPVTAQQAIPNISADYGDDSAPHTSSEKICEVCHSQTRYHRFDTTEQLADGGDLGHFNNADCMSCHPHRAGFRAGCSDCHGNSSTGAAWPDGLANNRKPEYAAFDDQKSHVRHVEALGGNASCGACHPLPEAGSTHLNTSVEVLEASFSYPPGTQTCSNISCHGNTDAQWGATSCLGCHGVVQGNRAAVGGQFAANSHHIQGPTVADSHCFSCHWEGNSDGTIAAAYHGGSNTPGATVDLVVYGVGIRPATYTAGVSAVQYSANGSRTEIAKLNTHCLACHSAQNSTTEPFGDGKTPEQYAWDGTSVDERYSQTETTLWGKYSGTNITPKISQTKAYSAHGNAVANQGGWDLNETWPDTRSGTVNIVCFDCHNSHGSQAVGTTTSYVSATTYGGILKDTTATLGGATATYRPSAGGSADDKNLRNAGASLCMDCHLTATADADYPWGYDSTFGATQKILGYDDSVYFGPTAAGAQQRYPYKAGADHKGGHFGASSTLKVTPTADHQINGLCTPCHDPHGVSPSLAAVQQYSVPLLKGSWLTSPYLEDVSPAQNASHTATPAGTKLSYHIDQNTFKDAIDATINVGVEGITQTDSQFGGLCLTCHPKDSLTDGTTHTWKSKDRIHEAVKGWKSANGTIQHTYPCSKCHTPHGGTGLARLMVTNCFNTGHKGRVNWIGSPTISGSDSMVGEGWGRVPGVYTYDDQWYVPAERMNPPSGSLTTACHEGNTGSPTNQSWNNLTPWGEPPPPVYGTIRIAWNDCENIPANAPTPLDSASWSVRSGSYGGALVASGSSGAGWDGIDDISVPVSATPYFVTINWSWDGGNDEGVVSIPDVLVTTEGQIVHLSY